MQPKLDFKGKFMTNKNTNKKIKKKILVLTSCLIVLWLVYEISCFLFKGIMPERKTLYLTYGFFRRDVGSTVHFMESLPKSASGNKYYHDVFFFTYENGYGTTISEQDYEETKAQCLKGREEFTARSLARSYINGQWFENSKEEQAKIKEELNIYSINDTDRLKPNVAEILEENGVNFFDKIARQDVEEGNYHFLWYRADRYRPDFEASIYNDETHEIIEVDYLKMEVDW